MNGDQRTRRRFLAGVSFATTIGLAGCTAPSSTGQSQTTEQAPQSTTNESTSSDPSHSTDGENAHSSDHGSTPDGPRSSATVTMKTNSEGTHFEPHIVWVEQGGSVTWELANGSHSTTAYANGNETPQRIPDDASSWDSGTLSEQGKTFEHTFETAGVYDYYCTPHEATGMLGSIIVGKPTPDGQPALAPPQDGLPGEAKKKLEALNSSVTQALKSSHHDDAGTTSENESDHH